MPEPAPAEADDPLRPLSRTRLYERVVERLRELIADRGLRAGDRLPPERELAERLGVSRASIRQAVVVLEVQGLVEVRHGGGTYLRRDRAEGDSLDELVERRRRLPEVLDAREGLETELAELAAQRRTAADLAAVEAALERMREQIDAGGRGEDGDRRFHAAVTAAARSGLLAEFMRTIDAAIAESRQESLRQPGRPAQSLAQHVRIAAAVRAGDPDEARAAMREHLATVRRVRLLQWEPPADDPEPSQEL